MAGSGHPKGTLVSVDQFCPNLGLGSPLLAPITAVGVGILPSGRIELLTVSVDSV